MPTDIVTQDGHVIKHSAYYTGCGGIRCHVMCPACAAEDAMREEIERDPDYQREQDAWTRSLDWRLDTDYPTQDEQLLASEMVEE